MMMKKFRRSVFVCGLSVILKIKKKYGLDGYHVKIDKKNYTLCPRVGSVSDIEDNKYGFDCNHVEIYENFRRRVLVWGVSSQ